VKDVGEFFGKGKTADEFKMLLKGFYGPARLYTDEDMDNDLKVRAM